MKGVGDMCARVYVCAQQKSLSHSPLNPWLSDKDACSQIHMSGSADGVEMQVLAQEIHLHSKTTRKKLRTHAIDKYRHANTAEGACVSLFYMRVHTHTHNYCSSILADALGLAKCIH